MYELRLGDLSFPSLTNDLYIEKTPEERECFAFLLASDLLCT